MNKNIKRYCELISEINSCNKHLDEEMCNFYSGGYTFEDVYKADIKELEELEDEFLILHKELNK